MKKNNNAFTLIELMIVITIIALIAVTIWKFNFKKATNKQKILNYQTKIINNIKTLKNNALIWKSIDVVNNNPIVPQKWKIEFLTWSATQKGWIITSYLSWWTWHKKNEQSFTFEKWFFINDINCESIWDSSTWTLNSTWTLIIEWSNLTISWCTDSNKQILNFETKYKSEVKNFSINSISWIITK